MKNLIRYFKRKRILMRERGYFRSITSNYVHPHLMAVFTPKELYKMSEEDFNLLIKRNNE